MTNKEKSTENFDDGMTQVPEKPDFTWKELNNLLDAERKNVKSNTLKEVEKMLEEYFDDLYIQIGMIGFAVPTSNVKGKGAFRVDLKQRLAELGGKHEKD